MCKGPAMPPTGLLYDLSSVEKPRRERPPAPCVRMRRGVFKGRMPVWRWHLTMNLRWSKKERCQQQLKLTVSQI